MRGKSYTQTSTTPVQADSGTLCPCIGVVRNGKQCVNLLCRELVGRVRSVAEGSEVRRHVQDDLFFLERNINIIQIESNIIESNPNSYVSLTSFYVFFHFFDYLRFCFWWAGRGGRAALHGFEVLGTGILPLFFF